MQEKKLPQKALDEQVGKRAFVIPFMTNASKRLPTRPTHPEPSSAVSPPAYQPLFIILDIFNLGTRHAAHIPCKAYKDICWASMFLFCF